MYHFGMPSESGRFRRTLGVMVEAVVHSSSGMSVERYRQRWWVNEVKNPTVSLLGVRSTSRGALCL